MLDLVALTLGGLLAAASTDVVGDGAGAARAPRGEAPAASDDNDDDDDNDNSDDDELPGPGETVIRTRRSPPPRAVNVPVRRQSLAVGGASAASLLALVPGVFVSQHAGQGKAPQLFLRGFDAEHGQDVEIRLEGIPLNEAGNLHGQGYADTTFIPIELVLRLRLDEGVADVRQGDFAVAGSIDHDVGFATPGVVAKGSLGSFGLRRAFVGARPTGSSERTFFGAEHVAGDGFGPARAFTRTSLLGGVEDEVLPGLTAFVFAATSTSSAESAGVVRLDDRRIADLDDDALFTAARPGQGLQAERHLGAVRLRHKAGMSSTTAQASWSRRRLALRHDFTGTLLFDEGDAMAQTSDADTLTLRAEHDVGVVMGDALQRLRVGGEARGDVVRAHQGRLRDDGSMHREEIDARFGLGHLGLWVDADVRPTPWLLLRPGLRLEGVAFNVDNRLDDSRRRTIGAVVVPRVAAVAKAGAEVDVSASYGEGFRSPPPLALADGETPPLTIVRTGEFGVQHRRLAAHGALTARASVFVTHVESDRVFDHATATSLFVGPSLRTGAQGFFDVVVHGVGVTVSATATGARFTSGGAVPFAPPLVLRLDAFCERPLGTVAGIDVLVRAELGAGLVGDRPLPFGERAAPVALIDGAVSAKVGIATLALETINLTDARVADSVFVYASRFAADDSRVPTRHITAASPCLAQVTLSLAW